MGTVILFPTPRPAKPRRTFWLTIPWKTDEEPLASRTRRGAVADIAYFDGRATVYKYVLEESRAGIGAARRRFTRAVQAARTARKQRTRKRSG